MAMGVCQVSGVLGKGMVNQLPVIGALFHYPWAYLTVWPCRPGLGHSVGIACKEMGLQCQPGPLQVPATPFRAWCQYSFC